MATLYEITLPQAKPAMEWLGGRALQKVSPTRKHGALQFAFAEAIKVWAKAGHPGQVVPEWRFRVTPPGQRTRPLVPDVAYMSYDRLRPLCAADREVPTVPPEIIIEIRSPDDRDSDVDEKRSTFLAWGVSLVLIADPDTRTVQHEDANGVRGVVDAVENFSPAMFPDLQLPLRAMFDELEIPDACEA